MRIKRLLQTWPLSNSIITPLNNNKKFLRLFTKKWGLVLFLISVGGLFGFAYLNWKGTSYTATASLEFLSSPANILGPSYVRNLQITPNEGRTHIYKIQSTTLASRVEKNISTDVKLTQDFWRLISKEWKHILSKKDMLSYLKDGVGAVYKDGVIMVTYSHPDPHVASRVVNIFTAEYVRFQTEVNSGNLGSEIEALKSEEERLLLTLDLKKRTLDDFLKDNPNMNLADPFVDTTRVAYMGAIVANEKKNAELEAQLTQVLPIVGNIEKLKTIPWLSSNQLVSDAISKQIILQEKLKVLGVRYGNMHPKIIEVNQLLNENQLTLKNAFAQAISSIEASWRESKTNLDVSKERLRQYTESLIKTKKVMQDYQSVFEDMTVVRVMLMDIQQKIAQASITKKAEFSSVRILSENEGIVELTSPKAWACLSIGAVTGLFCSLLLIGFLIRFDTYFCLDNLVQFEGLPVLCVLKKFPMIKSKGVNYGNCHSIGIFKNYFDELNASIFLKKDGHANRILLVTSSVPQEGKTFVASNLAINCALKNEKVMLLEVNYRHPSVLRNFSISSGKSLDKYLSQDSSVEQVTCKTTYDSLFIIGSGGVSANSIHKLNTNHFAELIQKLSKSYDRVIIDSPPLSLYGDANFIMPLCDSVLFVVGEGRVLQSLLVSTLNKLKISGINILGYVVNYSNTDFSGKERSDDLIDDAE